MAVIVGDAFKELTVVSIHDLAFSRIDLTDTPAQNIAAIISRKTTKSRNLATLQEFFFNPNGENAIRTRNKP